MKKVLYFTIGFVLPFIWFSLAYSECFDVTTMTANDPQAIADYLNYPEWQFTDSSYSSNSKSAALSAAQSENTEGKAAVPPTVIGNALLYQNSAGTEGYYANRIVVNGVASHLSVFPFSTVNPDGACLAQGLDSDGDGVPDWADAKTTDIDDYGLALKRLLLDSEGNIVYGLVQGEDGKTYAFGELPTDLTDYDMKIIPESDLIYKTNEDFYNALVDAGFDDTNTNLREITTGLDIGPSGEIIQPDPEEISDGYDLDDWWGDKQGDATEKNDDKMKPTEEKTGTETDSQALGKIITNTDATATNVQRLGDYLSEINGSLKIINGGIQSIDKSQAKATIIASDPTDDPGDDTEPEDLSAAAAALNDAAATTSTAQAVSDLTDALNEETTEEDISEHTGTEVEGLATSWWDLSAKIAEVVATNPMTDALLGVEVEAVGNCSFLYSWHTPSGSTKEIEFSVCGFSEELNTFGQILLMITNFSALFMLFRRN